MVINKENAVHYRWGAGCDCWVFAENDALSVKQERMPPGAKEILHFHQLAQQFFYVLKGKAVFYIDDRREVVQAGQGIHISPGTKHYIANETTDEIELLVISQPSTHHDRTEV